MILFVAVVLSRLVVPLFIPRYPLPALLAVLLIDAADQSLYEFSGVLMLEGYQTFDKALDIYYLTIAYAATIRNWAGGSAFAIGRVLWYYRLVGVVLFEHTGVRWLLLIFPNTFEFFFIAIELLKLVRDPRRFATRQLAGIAAAVWTFIKLPQEWWLHVAQLDLTDVIKQGLFDVPAASSWRAAVENRPAALAGVLLALLALAVLPLALLRRARAHDLFLGFSADRQAEGLGWIRHAMQPAGRVFSWALLEKAVLVSLVTLVFAEILPGQHNVVQVFVGTSLVIVASTALSHWLGRRGVTWRSASVQFVVMTATNLAIASAAGLLLRSPGTFTPPGTFIFLVALLTLIVVLFDRFRYVCWHQRSPAPVV